jgi:hypothetical protein
VVFQNEICNKCGCFTLWQKSQTPSAEFIGSENWQTLSAEFKIKNLAENFPLPWSAYVDKLDKKELF